MLDFTNWEIAGLAFDVVIVYLLNRWYKGKVKDADFVAVSFKLIIQLLLVSSTMKVRLNCCCDSLLVSFKFVWSQDLPTPKYQHHEYP